MFAGQGYAAAARRYAAVDTSSKVEGASPHQLVRILFDELLIAISAAAAAMRAGDEAKALDRETRALTILHALETSLDYEKGGEIAISLGVIYREARRRLIQGTAERSAAPIESARTFIADIAEAWQQIG